MIAFAPDNVTYKINQCERCKRDYKVDDFYNQFKLCAECRKFVWTIDGPAPVEPPLTRPKRKW